MAKLGTVEHLQQALDERSLADAQEIEFEVRGEEGESKFYTVDYVRTDEDSNYLVIVLEPSRFQA